ncbi:MAG: OmpA family protein [Lentimicrobiaceae bacterium]|nr:OmpA family protein [Lentimicrobiaceae bacterium]
MNRMQRISSLLALMLVVNVSAFAQKTPAEAADKAFNTFQYTVAADLYKKAYKKIRNNPVERRRVLYRMAECYYISENLKSAEQQYLRLEKMNYQKDNPSILLRLADIYRIRKDYPKALKYYERYQEARPKDPRSADRIEACKTAPLWINNPTRHEVENMKKFNSPGEDWSPMWGNSKETELVFTSSREGSTGKQTDAWTGGAFSDLYQSTKPKSKTVDFPGEWSTPILFDNTGAINTPANEGEASFNDKGTTIYFTRCPREKKEVQYCKIYQATRKGKGWGDPEEIKLGSDSFDYVHPCISGDELTLYFSSNMPGTMGGFDIWSATRSKKGKPFDDPVNLGPNVNSYDHDMYPSLENDSTLYISSKGHVGLGGYDIYKTRLENGKWTPVENLKYPINSEADDFGILFDHSEAIDPASGFPFVEKGFFTSTRSGGRGKGDIWSFKLRPIVFTLSGFVRDSVTMQYVDGATVTITAGDGTSYKTVTDIKGYYHFDKTKILGELTHDILVQKEGYYENENNRGRETTVGLTENKDLKRDFRINPLPKEPTPLPDILFDVSKWDLKPQYEDSLRGLLKTMQDNPTIVVELRSHTDFRAIAMTNDVLSQNRAQSCVEFLIKEGIDPERLVAKGYAERVPRVLDRDRVSRGVTFKKGTVLTPEYIKALRTENEREGAHALNRRTEFFILRTDYVPKGVVEKVDPSKVEYKVEVVQRRSIPVQTDDKLVFGTCYANSKTVQFKIEPDVEQLTISYDQAMNFLKEAIITVGDFEEGVSAINEDGTIIDKSIVYLSTLQIGEEVLENAKMIVVKEQKEAVIIGSKTFVEEFGTYTVDKGEQKLFFDK